MGSRLASLLPLLLATAASSQPLPSWLQGRWLFRPASEITDAAERWAQFQTDSEGTLYHTRPFQAFRKGNWSALPGKPLAFFMLAIRSRSDYWIADSTWITHWKDGQGRRYDSTNSCLRGNQLNLAGFDRDGRLLVERREWRGTRSLSHGAVRFTESACEDVPRPPGEDSTLVLWSYFSDTLGREYFSNVSNRIVLPRNIFYRLDQGRLDTLGESWDARNFVSVGATWIARGSRGLHRVLGNGRLEWVESVRGDSWHGEVTHYKDSRGVLWIGVGSLEQVHAYPPGALPWDSTERAVFDARNAGFPDGHAVSIAEDDAGNVWVEFSGGQFSVFARDTAGLAARHPGLREAFRAWHPWREAVDALGRRASGTAPGATRNPAATPPRRVLFPAPSKP